MRCDGYASVTYLLKRGADASLATDNGSTPLHAAASRNRENMVRLLCEHGCDTLVEDCKGLIPEWYAANKGYCKVADFLRETRAKQEALKGKSQPQTKRTVKPKNFRATKQLQTAIDSSDLELCRLLVASRGTEILELQQLGPMPTSALIHAIFSDQPDIATHLIEAGSPITGRTNTPGYGVFHACAEMGHTSVLETLLRKYSYALPDRGFCGPVLPIYLAVGFQRSGCLNLILEWARDSMEPTHNKQSKIYSSVVGQGGSGNSQSASTDLHTPEVASGSQVSPRARAALNLLTGQLSMLLNAQIDRRN